ncbi:imidazole glycerol phosphate synthase subunit HisH [Desulfonatronum thiodismutans]|uniref:imidazole glycerol phosphate synthase subunit HisH n=1 Tax=Desulfonatronum thiodismutans TaxID=159290 RepID=UPI0004ABEBDD|nr:imidazole glycerol phosphate synthase subunit HisH [Desulfonatronum thiodismutans]
MKRIAIMDYGMCNLDSVARAVAVCKAEPRIVREAGDMIDVDGLILPGVGAFPDAMDELDRLGLSSIIREMVLDQGRPFLGICLGMQLMADEGTEGVSRAGLGLLPGRAVRLVPDTNQTRIPHVGWNEVHHTAPSALFVGIPSGTDFYFVHSYHVQTEPDHILATTPYCGGFVSAVGHGTIFGTQFHPEKSLTSGLKLLENFLALC